MSALPGLSLSASRNSSSAPFQSKSRVKRSSPTMSCASARPSSSASAWSTACCARANASAGTTRLIPPLTDSVCACAIAA